VNLKEKVKTMYSVEELQKIINIELQNRSKELEKRNPFDLYSPVKYSLGIGGKRLRPILVLLSNNLFNDKIESALPAAIAIEVFHNFTLLHDDIMDNADVRRNQPTVHKKFSENTAILSGDAMAFLAYQYLFETNSERIKEVALLFSKTAIEVCEGQQFDMDFENRLDVTEFEYLEMIRLKTAVLLACSLKTGALLGNANGKLANQLYDFGLNLGLAFQLQDDLLDTFGDEKTFGKKIGGDILANKKTYLLIKALENSSAKQKSELLNWIDKKEYVDEKKIESIKSIYSQLNIKKITQQKIDSYFQKSSRLLEDLAIPKSKKQSLTAISNMVLKREN